MQNWCYPRRAENAKSHWNGSFPLLFQYFLRTEFLECDYFGSSLPKKSEKIIWPSFLTAADSIHANREELEERKKKQQHKCSTFAYAKYSNFFFKSLSKLSSLFQLHWQQRVSFVLNQLSEWVTFTEAAGTCQAVSFCPWFFSSRSFTVRIIKLVVADGWERIVRLVI